MSVFTVTYKLGFEKKHKKIRAINKQRAKAQFLKVVPYASVVDVR